MYSRTFDPAITHELRIYLFGGEDKVIIRNNHSPIKIRLIADGASDKTYAFSGKARYLRKVHVYEGDTTSNYTGETGPVHIKRSGAASNSAVQLTDRYNKTAPLLTAGFNADDGLILGAGLRWIRQGFRKTPFASRQE
ncbi:MAG TPA: hypothetical protein VL307_05735, partial [Chitinophagaceae bacterium]|nr:hypothetical protein [Chitinophagaceae bacterium]